ncbi:MAG: acetate--CoA ligase [Flavobacteriales bacterium]|nr:acetate--CoA ligase [Flavobacteriales bacterium]
MTTPFRITNWDELAAAQDRSKKDPEGFWADMATAYSWRKPWTSVLEWDFIKPNVQWFIGGQLNITENCLDRHLATRGEKTALIWEANDPQEASQRISYRELHERVCRMANVLKKRGVRKGDRVCLYMPMIPELAISVLACARIGAIHSVVFGGFSANSLVDRINDSQCSVVITSDGIRRGAKNIPAKSVVDEALSSCPSVHSVLVAKCTGDAVHMALGRDHWFEEDLLQTDANCPAEPMESEDPLFILYTSGSTGKPKGVVHTCGGYMVYAGYSFANVFQCEENNVFWCTADIGWITGHSYIVYGPLLNGTTSVMFEGIPSWPDPTRFWQVIEKHKVNQFYTAPTAIRSLMAAGHDLPSRFAMPSLKLLGSVGEPINEEAWHWYHEQVGKKRCAVVDTWWQTETGGIMLSGLGDITPMKPAHAGLPLPGIRTILVDQQGNELHGEAEGYLCIDFPWPSVIRTTWGDHERCRLNYFAQYPGRYFTGDGAKRDADGFFRIIGRVDDVINVSGHRIGTAEVENAIDEHPDIVESAVVGYPHDIKGQGIYAFVICDHVRTDKYALRNEVIATVERIIGKIARPDKIQFVSGLPKTRSGKIMRRILRKVAEGEMNNLGDTSTLLDPGVVEEIKAGKL